MWRPVFFIFLLHKLTSSESVSTIIHTPQLSGSNVSLGDEHFTGHGWIDTIHEDNETTIADVLFLPGARTNWHTHHGGQLLRVVAGSGWICDEGGKPQRLMVGDLAWCPPGVTHWHGASDGSYLIHQAIAHGATSWLDAVSDEEYNKTRLGSDPERMG
ncbi:hypothetical protein LT330_001889 [Penicillium expansum]|nr:hypothetical protein LT330_001889 [Penicillium expansum]